MGFGKPKYGNTSFKTVRVVKEGESLRFRILPPMFTLENKGQWSQSHKQHFGYAVQSKTDPAKFFPRPFYCVEQFDFRTKTVLEHCPECDKIKVEKDRLASAKDALKKKGFTEEKINEAVKPVANWVSKHNLDNKVYLNVKFTDGSYGTIKVAWTVKKEIDKLVNSLIKPEGGRKKIEPIDPDEGVWFEVTRTGKGFKTEYTVKIVTEPLTVEVPGRGTLTVEEVKKAPLVEEDCTKASEVCYDLVDVGIPSLTVDRINTLVNGNGTPEEVEAVFGVPEREASPEPAEESPAPVQTTVSNQITAPVMQLSTTPTPPAVSEPTAVSGPAVASDDPSTWSEEQFQAMFGIKP